jgi:hypothetical protein
MIPERDPTGKMYGCARFTQSGGVRIRDAASQCGTHDRRSIAGGMRAVEGRYSAHAGVPSVTRNLATILAFEGSAELGIIRIAEDRIVISTIADRTRPS